MTKRNKYDCIVIGAGASGLLATLFLQSRNKRVLLLEKKKQAGLKLRLTGKGRCNLTNTLSLDEFLSHCSSVRSDKRDIIPSLKHFSNKDTIKLFQDLGVELIEERGRRIYPKSGKSLDIFLALINQIENSPLTTIKFNQRVSKFLLKNNKINGVKISDGTEYYCDKVLLCVGGKTYPQTGSEGDGFKLAKESGHKITPTYPALVGLRTERGHHENLQNYLIKNTEAKILNNKGEVIAKESGDITIDEYGFSGPAILKLSRKIAKLLYKDEDLQLKIDIKPKIKAETLLQEINSVIKERQGMSVENIVRAWLPKELCFDFKQWYREEKKQNKTPLPLAILTYLKDQTDTIIGDMGWDEAIITQGGISLSEINCKTMESKKIKGLYFAGEELDIDADTGGFNLQIAFSSAALASDNI
jgi:predicted Rossmann fold flavoprotein